MDQTHEFTLRSAQELLYDEAIEFLEQVEARGPASNKSLPSENMPRSLPKVLSRLPAAWIVDSSLLFAKNSVGAKTKSVATPFTAPFASCLRPSAIIATPPTASPPKKTA